jgi:hypothetical protein
MPAGAGISGAVDALHLHQKRGSAMSTVQTMTDDQVAEFLALARSANIYFEIIHDRLHMRAFKPNWEMWRPCRHLLDEIGQERIEAYVRARTAEQNAVARWTHASAERLQVAAEAMR